MPRYQITADVTVELNMEVEAESREAAEALFNDGISMTAGMAGTPDATFEVWDDAISDVDRLEIRLAAGEIT